MHDMQQLPDVPLAYFRDPRTLPFCHFLRQLNGNLRHRAYDIKVIIIIIFCFFEGFFSVTLSLEGRVLLHTLIQRDQSLLSIKKERKSEKCHRSANPATLHSTSEWLNARNTSLS
jgi:hypothetical protein